jgi:hypothetical protein
MWSRCVAAHRHRAAAAAHFRLASLHRCIARLLTTAACSRHSESIIVGATCYARGAQLSARFRLWLAVAADLLERSRAWRLGAVHRDTVQLRRVVARWQHARRPPPIVSPRVAVARLAVAAALRVLVAWANATSRRRDACAAAAKRRRTGAAHHAVAAPRGALERWAALAPTLATRRALRASSMVLRDIGAQRSMLRAWHAATEQRRALVASIRKATRRAPPRSARRASTLPEAVHHSCCRKCVRAARSAQLTALGCSSRTQADPTTARKPPRPRVCIGC